MFYEFEFFQPVDFLELSKELFANFEDFESGISSLKGQFIIGFIFPHFFMFGNG